MTWPQYRHRECIVNGVKRRLEPREAEFVLLLLLGDPAKFLTNEHFIEALWPNPDDEPESASANMVSVYMSRLRRRHGIVIEHRWRDCKKLVDTFGGHRIPAHARGSCEPLKVAA